MLVKLKKLDFVLLAILLFTVSILTLVICNIKWGIITLGPNEETKVRVNGHSESLDSIIHVEVIPVTTDGKIKLSRGDDWFEPEKGIGYNVKDSRIETYHYNEKTKSWDVTILENPHNGIGVDREGIIMDPPQKTLFSFASKKGFEIKIKNISDQTVEFKVKVTYD
ncbi:hypothetical protein [Streptococcus infantis]|jgi:hypothetical protein|uniref:hypothetical protein n=1 Tax=Streptococcus infantis TaxID=68892 RepID=UPI0039C022DF